MIDLFSFKKMDSWFTTKMVEPSRILSIQIFNIHLTKYEVQILGLSTLVAYCTRHARIYRSLQNSLRP